MLKEPNNPSSPPPHYLLPWLLCNI
uniref:Uncharacterized protein n=1 Tax=Arundo donax TaxID=35708 RepID=A0A0A9EQX8_ARUDO